MKKPSPGHLDERKRARMGMAWLLLTVGGVAALDGVSVVHPAKDPTGQLSPNIRGPHPSDSGSAESKWRPVSDAIEEAVHIRFKRSALGQKCEENSPVGALCSIQVLLLLWMGLLADS